jgi:hypothetical protein
MNQQYFVFLIIYIFNHKKDKYRVIHHVYSYLCKYYKYNINKQIINRIIK